MSKKNTLPRKPIPHNPTPVKPPHRSRLMKLLFPSSEWSTRSAKSSASETVPQPVRLASPKGAVPAPGGVKEQNPVAVVYVLLILLAAVGIIFFARKIHNENVRNRPSDALIYTDGTIDPDREEEIGSQRRSPEASKVAAQYNEVQNRMDAPDPEEIH